MERWALRRQGVVTARVNASFAGLDLILTPTLAQPPVHAGKWHGQGSLRTSFGVRRWCPFTSLANLIGNGAASVPAGFTDSGLPVGAELLAAPGNESALVAIAAQLEDSLRLYEATPPAF
jgi:amidase